jgi:hypothetical protein
MVCRKSCALNAELRRENFRGDFCAAFVREFAQWLRRYPQPALVSARVDRATALRLLKLMRGSERNNE